MLLTKQQKSPKWDVLDKEVSGKRGHKRLRQVLVREGNWRQQNTHNTRGEGVLHVHNPLEFKKEKVGKIMNFVEQLLNRVPRDGVIAFGAH